MNVKVYDSYEALSAFAANEIIQAVIRNKNTTICLAAGQSPQRTYEIVTRRARAEYVDFSSVNVVGLDEWVGISPNDTGSCQYFLKKYFIDPLELHPRQYRLFDALSADLEHQCESMNDHIASLGGLDIVVLGIGMNGHLGFNEPGVDLNLNCHVIPLDPVTGTVGQKYFTKATELHHGITVGMSQLLKSRLALLLANGKHKSSIVAATVNKPLSNSIPASVMRLHTHCFLLLDHEAASEL